MMTVESDGVSNEHLNPFNLINLSEILFLIQGSKSTTCPLDPIATQIIVVFLTRSIATGYVPLPPVACWRSDPGSL